MSWTPRQDGRVRAAAGFLAVATLLAGWSALDALRPPSVVPVRGLVPAPPADTAMGRPARSASFAALDPFGAARVAPAEGGDGAPALPMPITLVGTVMGGDRPAAICRAGLAPARILAIGDTLAGWRLIEVGAARAVFIDAARERHELRLTPPGN